MSQGSYPRTHQQGAYLFYTLRLKSEMRTLNCRKQKTPVNAYRTIAARHVQVGSLAPLYFYSVMEFKKRKSKKATSLLVDNVLLSSIKSTEFIVEYLPFNFYHVTRVQMGTRKINQWVIKADSLSVGNSNQSVFLLIFRGSLYNIRL